MTKVTIELENNIAKKWNNLIQFFGNDNILFEDFVNFHRNKIKREIIHLEKDLESFEKKYNLLSKDFYAQFEAGKLEDSNDFIIWSGVYEMTLNSKQNLEKIA